MYEVYACASGVVKSEWGLLSCQRLLGRERLPAGRGRKRNRNRQIELRVRRWHARDRTWLGMSSVVERSAGSGTCTANFVEGFECRSSITARRSGRWRWNPGVISDEAHLVFVNMSIPGWPSGSLLGIESAGAAEVGDLSEQIEPEGGAEADGGDGGEPA